jgi:hypothetical protein
MFCLPQYIDSSAAIIFASCTTKTACAACIAMRSQEAACYLGEVDAVHPFRVGTGGHSGPSSRSSPAILGSRSPGSTLMQPATSRPPPRSCAAIPDRCARCSARSSGTTRAPQGLHLTARGIVMHGCGSRRRQPALRLIWSLCARAGDARVLLAGQGTYRGDIGHRLALLARPVPAEAGG